MCFKGEVYNKNIGNIYYDLDSELRPVLGLCWGDPLKRKPLKVTSPHNNYSPWIQPGTKKEQFPCGGCEIKS